jgi:hypothetical protein
MPGIAAKPRPRLAGVLVLVGATAVVVAPFLPWLEATAPFVGTISRSLMALTTSDGPLVLGLAACGGLLGLLLTYRGPSIALGITVLVVALPAFGIVIYDFTQVSGRVAEVMSTSTSSFVVIANVGPGPYVAGLGILIWVIGGLVAIMAPRSLQILAPAIAMPASVTDSHGAG